MSYQYFTYLDNYLWQFNIPNDTYFILSQYEVTNRNKDNTRFPIIYQYDDIIKFLSVPFDKLLLTYDETWNLQNDQEIVDMKNKGLPIDQIDIYYYYTWRWIKNMTYSIIDDNLLYQSPYFTMEILVKSNEFDDIVGDYKFKSYKLDLNKIYNKNVDEYMYNVGVNAESLSECIQYGLDIQLDKDYIMQYDCEVIGDTVEIPNNDINFKLNLPTGKSIVDIPVGTVFVSIINRNLVSQEII